MAFEISSSVFKISLRKLSSLLYSKLLLWLYPWLAIKCPSSYARLTISGCSLTCLPTTKNVALTFSFSSTSKILGVTLEVGPSSKVKYTTFSSLLQIDANLSLKEALKISPLLKDKAKVELSFSKKKTN